MLFYNKQTAEVFVEPSSSTTPEHSKLADNYIKPSESSASAESKNSEDFYDCNNQGSVTKNSTTVIAALYCFLLVSPTCGAYSMFVALVKNVVIGSTNLRNYEYLHTLLF